MSIHKEGVELRCDGCDGYCFQSKLGFDNAAQARDSAKRQGWTRKGRHGDLCPECSVVVPDAKGGD